MKNLISAALSALFLVVSVSTFATNAPKKAKSACIPSSCCSTSGKATASTKVASGTRLVAVTSKAGKATCPNQPGCICE